MQRGIETQPSSPSIFEGLRSHVETRIRGVEEETEKAGQAIRIQIGSTVKLIKEGILPEKVAVADITPYTGMSPTELTLVRYLPETNELVLVSKNVGKVEDFEHGSSSPTYVSLPKNQQSERTLRILSGKEWVHYGLLTVQALEKAVKEAEQRRTEPK